MTPEEIQQVVDALKAASDHLEWCNYGGRYERECAVDDNLPEQIAAALKVAGVKEDESLFR